MVVKDRRYYTKMSNLIKLNEVKGAPAGTTHISDHSCAVIIVKEIKAAFVSRVKSLDVPISITLGESTWLCVNDC